MTTKEKIDIDIIRIRILKDFERKFLECREIGFEKVLDGILRKHLQEPTEEREAEIIDEMKKLKSSLDKLKSMGLSVTYNTYYSLIEELRENNIILA